MGGTQYGYVDSLGHGDVKININMLKEKTNQRI